MKSYKYILAAATLTVLAACSAEDAVNETFKGAGIPIKLSYAIGTASDTRAAQNLNQGTFDVGEQIRVRIHNESNTSDAADYIYTTAADGAMIAPTPTPEYPTDGSTIKIYSWYPCTDVTDASFSTGNFDFTIKTDQTADADYKDSDLLYAKAINLSPQSEPVELAYTHRMAKINVNIITGTGITSINSVKILNVKPTHRFKVTGNLISTATGDPTAIAVSNHGAAIIPPQTISGELLEIETEKGTAIYTLTNPKEFESGKQYTLNITVSDRAVNAPVNTTNVITGWSDNGTAIVYGQEPLTVKNVTADNLLWLITSDGYVYENYAAVQAVGKTPVALICYVGEPGTADASGSYRGLAMALGDAANGEKRMICTNPGNSVCIKPYNKFSWGFAPSGVYSQYDARSDIYGIQNTYAWHEHYTRKEHRYYIGSDFDSMCFPAAIENNGTPIPPGTSGWFMPSAGQWNKMMCTITGCQPMPSAWYKYLNTYNYNLSKGTAINARLAQAGLTGTAYDPAFKCEKTDDCYWTSSCFCDDSGKLDEPGAYVIDFYNGYFKRGGFIHIDDETGVLDSYWIRCFLAF